MTNSQKQLRLKLLLGAVTFGALSACSGVSGTHFPVDARAQDSVAAAQALHIVRVDVTNIKSVMAEEEAITPVERRAITFPPNTPYVYRVGPGDVLQVSLWDSPERMTPTGSEPPNLVVSEEGTIFYPFVGELPVEGKSASDIRKDLTVALSDYLQSPQVELAVVGFNAHNATLLGQVGNQGRYGLTNVPLTLLDALNKAGRMERADLSRVTLRRNGQEYVVDLTAFIERGDERHNPILLPEDVVIVEPPTNGTVYTFGEVGVGELTLGLQETSLTSVLAKRGGLDKLRADAKGVFVFRARKPIPAAPPPVSPGITVYQFELDQPAMLVLAQTFEMRGGDVVFVTQEPISRWNDMVGKLLSPVVTTLRAQAVVTALTDD